MTVIDEKNLTHLRIIPETPNFGAVIEGVDAKERLSDEVIEALKDALLQYKVLFLRNQNLSPKQQNDFANRFGSPFENTGYGKVVPDYEEPGLSTVTVVPHFHADLMYMEEGPSFSMLQILESPEIGGDTMWADLDASYNTLSQPIKDMLEGLTARHVMPHYYLSDDELAAVHKQKRGEDLSREQLKERRFAMRPHEHPLVRRIPETGTKNYWVSEQHTEAIIGLRKSESDAILSLLFRHQLQPEFIIRWHWTVGDIAFWDHRRTLHSGINDFGSHVRRGQRASIAPNRPLPI